MGNTGRNRRGSSKPYYLSSQYGITVNLGSRNYFSEIGEAESEKEELAEIKRLLYVALTRAQSHLVLAGTHRLRNRTSARAHLNLLLRGLDLNEQSLGKESRITEDFDLQIHPIEALRWEALSVKIRPDGGIASGRLDELYRGPPIRRTIARQEITVSELCGYLDPLLEQRRKRLELSTKVTHLPAIEADGLLKEHELESRFGTLTHQLLARWGPDPGGAPPEPDWSAIPRKLRRPLLAGAAALCRNFFDSELGALSANASRSERELPFLYLHRDEQGDLYISGKIDLVFEWQDRLYLVDFKTDRLHRPGEHEGQLALYRLALREQTDREIRTFLFLLRSGEAQPSGEEIDAAEWIPKVRHLL